MQMHVVWDRDMNRMVMIAPAKIIGKYYQMHTEAIRRIEAGGGDFYPKTLGGHRVHLHIGPAENVTYDRPEASLPRV